MKGLYGTRLDKDSVGVYEFMELDGNDCEKGKTHLTEKRWEVGSFKFKLENPEEHYKNYLASMKEDWDNDNSVAFIEENNKIRISGDDSEEITVEIKEEISKEEFESIEKAIGQSLNTLKIFQSK